MKANQRVRNSSDEAVSPVIAIILMVAITVVLAATVYVWVSGFSASGSQAKTIAISTTSNTGGIVTLTLSSVSTGTNWQNLKVQFQNAGTTTYGVLVSSVGGCSAFSLGTWDGGSTIASGTSCPAAAGDIIKVGVSSLGASGSDTVLQVIDKSSNTVVTSVTMPTMTTSSQAPTISSGTTSSPFTLTWSESSVYTTTPWSGSFSVNNNAVFTVGGASPPTMSGTITNPAVASPETITYSAGTPTHLTTTLNAGATKLYDIFGNQWSAQFTY